MDTFFLDTSRLIVKNSTTQVIDLVSYMDPVHKLIPFREYKFDKTRYGIKIEGWELHKYYRHKTLNRIEWSDYKYAERLLYYNLDDICELGNDLLDLLDKINLLQGTIFFSLDTKNSTNLWTTKSLVYDNFVVRDESIDIYFEPAKIEELYGRK